MMKRIFLVVVLLLATFSFGAGEFDKEIVVKNQSRNDKVKLVFREMMNAYEEEDIGQFFSYVSEDRFQQDYMTFYDAIDEDIRVYDILSVDTWVNKTTEDGVKRFLNVQWEKRYESSKPVGLNESDLAVSSEYEIFQRGTTEFLFDEINGKYKLIQIAGNNFWGGSLKDWTDEVGDIAGQSSKVIVGDNVNGSGLPDLTVTITDCSAGNISFNLINLGDNTTVGDIEYQTFDGAFGTTNSYVYNNDIAKNGSISIVKPHTCDAVYGGRVTIDYNDVITESDETNNEASL